MSKVAIVTDSTAYIPKEFVDQYDLSVAPQTLIWGSNTFRDGIDILPDEFYRRLEKAKLMPSTSQVTPGAFHEIFKQKLDEGKDVLAILIAHELSGTISSAIQAKELLPGAPVEIVDSRTTAMAMGFHVLAVARAAEQGATLEECKQLALEARAHTGVFFAVDTLEFLHRGGRIGGAAAFLGSALKLKPVLEIRDGCVEPIERVRTRSKSLERLVELVGDRSGGKHPLRLATLHANAYQDAAELLERTHATYGSVERILSEVSPVVGTHAGPGTVGVAFMAGM